MIKLSFQFLDSPCFCLKYSAVLLVRQCKEIYGSIVRTNAIQMVNNPATRQGLVMCLFPDQDVFSHISPCVGSGMIWQPNKDIISVPNPPAFPLWHSFARSIKAMVNTIFRIKLNKLATNRAGFHMLGAPPFAIFPPFSPNLFAIHTFIISQVRWGVKRAYNLIVDKGEFQQVVKDEIQS